MSYDSRVFYCTAGASNVYLKISMYELLILERFLEELPDYSD